jgi:hypothetical protein
LIERNCPSNGSYTLLECNAAAMVAFIAEQFDPPMRAFLGFPNGDGLP